MHSPVSQRHSSCEEWRVVYQKSPRPGKGVFSDILRAAFCRRGRGSPDNRGSRRQRIVYEDEVGDLPGRDFAAVGDAERAQLVVARRLHRLVQGESAKPGPPPEAVGEERDRAGDVRHDGLGVVRNVAGSVALFPDCFRRLVRVTGWPLHEAVKAAGYNQLRSLGITDRGEIAAGQVADLVLVDDALSPQMTVARGTVAWKSGII